MKKIFYTLIITVLMLALIAVPCLAAEDGASTAESEEQIPTPEDESREEKENPFEYIYSTVVTYSSQIMSALACIFSATIMLCYKKGILPLIKGGLGAISCGVKELEKEAQRQSQGNEDHGKLIEEQLGKARDVLEKIEGSFSDYEKRLQSCEGEAMLSESFRGVLLTQIEMMYEIFMSASMPQYEKDRIGAMVSDMKSKLNTGVVLCEEKN
jgi:hypothetical protein